MCCRLTFLILLIFTTQAFSQEFNHLNIDAQILRTKFKRLKGRPSFDFPQDSLAKSFSGLRTSSFQTLSAGPLDNLNPIGDESHPLYNEILQELTNHYQQTGWDLSGNILAHNERFNLGSNNYQGFSWQKPMGSFGIAVNRKVEPDLFSDQFIAIDSFTIFIDATTFLQTLQENQEELGISLSDSDIALFAGLSFRREYRYAHMADSYQAALTKDFSKLFLNFLMFKPQSLLQIKENEFLSKEDFLSAKAGGLFKSPSFYGVSASAGFLASYDLISKTTIKGVGRGDSPKPGEFLRLSFNKEEGKRVDAVASIQADFLSLLNITLLSAEYSYRYSESDQIDLTLFEKDKPLLEDNNPVSQQIGRILSFQKYNEDILKDFKVSRVQRIKENESSKYTVLLWGGLKSSKTEQTKITMDDESRNFFTHTTREIKYTEDFFSKLFGFLLRGIFGNSFGGRYYASKERMLQMEYEVEEIKAPKNVQLESEEHLSILLHQKYFAKKTKGWWNRKYKKHALQMISRYTSLSHEVKEMIKDDVLVGPMAITTRVQVNKDALGFFLSLSQEDARLAFYDLCRKGKEKVNSSAKKCFKKINKYYKAFVAEFEEWKTIPLWKFKNFVRVVHQFTDRKSDLNYLFGRDNIFFHGNFNAKVKGGRSYQTFFQEGEFEDLGLIDSFRRSHASRAPAGLR